MCLLYLVIKSALSDLHHCSCEDKVIIDKVTCIERLDILLLCVKWLKWRIKNCLKKKTLVFHFYKDYQDLKLKDFMTTCQTCRKTIKGVTSNCINHFKVSSSCTR